MNFLGLTTLTIGPKGQPIGCPKPFSRPNPLYSTPFSENRNPPPFHHWSKELY